MSQNCTYDLQLACCITTKQKRSHDLQKLFKEASLGRLTTVADKIGKVQTVLLFP